MGTSTRARCAKYAAAHNLSITIFGSYNVAYTVDLPDGMITEQGNTGLGGQADTDQKMPEIWGAIMEDMQALTAQKWSINLDQ